ncbi:hypothetical protein LR48_Vigan03g125200 [Vigna angularis]|uniref:Uncharacterized protein n=1 Tax=Phaseolus angularis TaxID=3914 RepID=A0A0L9U503_PHAAN|nr:hypothetical protein LR48_Vigan03g125200 [Vigna angularis]
MAKTSSKILRRTPDEILDGETDNIDRLMYHKKIGLTLAQEELTQLRLSEAIATAAAVDCYKTLLEAYGAWTTANSAWTAANGARTAANGAEQRQTTPGQSTAEKKTDEDGSNGCSGGSEQREEVQTTAMEVSRRLSGGQRAARELYAPVRSEHRSGAWQSVGKNQMPTPTGLAVARGDASDLLVTGRNCEHTGFSIYNRRNMG